LLIYSSNTAGHQMSIANLKLCTSNTTPQPPVVTGDDAADLLTASSSLGTSEIEVSVNGGAWTAYTGTINVGNVARPQGYWLFKIKAAPGRNESAVVQSPAFTITNTTPQPPVVTGDDAADLLSASSPLGTSEIEVSVNGGAWTAYIGTINVGNVARPQGYWLFKIKAAPGRNESAVVQSPAFTITNTTPQPPVVTGDDAAD